MDSPCRSASFHALAPRWALSWMPGAIVPFCPHGAHGPGTLLEQDRDFLLGCQPRLCFCLNMLMRVPACFQVAQGKRNQTRNGIIDCVLAREEVIRGAEPKGTDVTLYSAIRAPIVKLVPGGIWGAFWTSNETLHLLNQFSVWA